MSTLPAVRGDFDVQALISQGLATNANVDTMERLFALAERMQAIRAREAYSRALVQFQRECPPIIKRETAKIRTRGGGDYAYNYASLDGILDVAQPVMGQCGLSNTWKTRTDGKTAWAAAVIRHELGHEETTDEVAIPIEQAQEGGSGASPAQRVGIALSYAKRYALLSALGLAPEKDKDGAWSPGPAKQPDPEPEGQVTTISDGQVKRFWAIARQSGWKEEEVKTLLTKEGFASTSAITTSRYDALVLRLKGGTEA